MEAAYHFRRSPGAMPMSSQEPSVSEAPVRRFNDPTYVPLAPSLAGLRQRIDALDEQIIGLIAERALCVRDATRFKRNAFQVAAPARQAEVFSRVRALAERHEANFPGLPDIVEATYRTLVAGFIAGEGHLFQQTEAIE
jgi:isochorismate pyruvate lyase